MDYKTLKVVLDMYWHKNADLRDNLINIFSRDFTLHKKSGAKGFFAIENDPLRYRQLKKVIMDKLTNPNVSVDVIHESLTYCHLNMELRQINERPISDEMFFKTEYALDKIEKAYPELRRVRVALSCEYWDDVHRSTPDAYRQLLSPKI